MYPSMPVDQETQEFLRKVKLRQRVLTIGGIVLAVLVAVAVLVWPDEVRQGIVSGATAVWRLLQMVFGGLF